MKKFTSRLTAAVGVAVGGLLTATPVWAQLQSIVPQCARLNSGKAPDLNCALATFGNIAELAFQIIGSLVLLMFVYGGFKIIYSSGNSSKAKEGLSILRNAVIGMVVVLLAGYIVEYGLAQMKIISIGSTCFVDGIDNQPGIMREIKGVMRCVDNCDRLKPEGYSCRDTGTLTDAGLCVSDLCPGGTNNRCCPNDIPVKTEGNATPTTPAADGSGAQPAPTTPPANP